MEAGAKEISLTVRQFEVILTAISFPRVINMKVLRRSLLCSVLIAAFVTGGMQQLVASTRSSQAAVYLDRLLENIASRVQDLPHMTTVSEAVAKKMLAGGKLWIGGDMGFILEGCNRSGGIMTAKSMEESESIDRVSAGDVILLGSLTGYSPEDVALLEAADERGALVVFFAPQNLPGSYLFIDALAPPADDPAVLPTVSPALAISLWTFTGELVAALTRHGKMPPMYKSATAPGGMKRNDQHRGRQWEPLAIPPIRPMVIGRTYLARIANIMRRVQATQINKFVQAGQMAAETLGDGGTVWYGTLGHLTPDLPGQTGDPGLLKPFIGKRPERLPTVLKAGDLVMYVGYYEPYGPWVETVHQCGARIVTIVSGTPERRAEDMGADLNISGCWSFGDALVEVPGYDVNILPPSGVIQSAAYWMLVAETADHWKGE